MAWTTPRTWCNGQLIDMARMNDHLRDNLPSTCEWCGGDPGRLAQCVHCGAPVVTQRKEKRSER